MNSKTFQRILFALFAVIFMTFGCAMGDEGNPTDSSAGVDKDGDKHVDINDGGDDCNDDNAKVHPGAVEDCTNGIDDDCNGKKDADDPACTDNDVDNDGYTSTATGGKDCNDNDPKINPGATDICGDGIDQDCSGADSVCSDNDADNDGYDSTASGGKDCNDNDASIHPNATDVCGNGKDEDCSGADAVCPSTDECTGTTSVSCGSECASGNGTKTCSNGKWGSCSCTTVQTGPKPCASMPNVTEWETVTLIAYAPEASTVRFEGMCGVYDSSLKKWTASSDYTVIPGCEAKSGSGGTFTCTTKRPKGWSTFEGNNYLNNGYWSVGVLTLSEAQAVCPSSYNSTTKTCNDLWSVMSKHGDYSINGVACQTSVNWVINGNSDSFNCRVTK